jgi:hypothetical protein
MEDKNNDLRRWMAQVDEKLFLIQWTLVCIIRIVDTSPGWGDTPFWVRFAVEAMVGGCIFWAAYAIGLLRR